MPARLPKPADIRDAIMRCDRTLEGRGVSPAHARQCFAKLLAAFEPSAKASGDETRLRMAVWLEACGDLNDALWAAATTEAIQTLKWMPKPAEFRAIVTPQLDLARRQKHRLEQMAEAVAYGANKPFVREPDDVRIRGLRDSFRKIGSLHKAAGYERSLARMENREPEDWIHAAAVADMGIPISEKPATPPARPPSPEMRAALDVALATHHRAQGRDAYADQLEHRAALAGFPPALDEPAERMEAV